MANRSQVSVVEHPQAARRLQTGLILRELPTALDLAHGLHLSSFVDRKCWSTSPGAVETRLGRAK
jgi:hypothetical protein